MPKTIKTTIDVCKDIKFSQLTDIINWASCVMIKTVVPFLFTLATVGFIWGIIQYFINPDNEEKRKAGKSYMLWGIIALFFMLSMWGLVGIFTNTFGVKTLIPQLSQ
jgi:hypothetical protein